jgi:hypothetical protein
MASNVQKADEERGGMNFNNNNRNSHHGAGDVKDYFDPLPVALIDWNEFASWSLYRAILTEFIATLLFLYIAINTVIGAASAKVSCEGVGILGISWAFGGMIFVLVYCTAGISGKNPNSPPSALIALYNCTASRDRSGAVVWTPKTRSMTISSQRF